MGEADGATLLLLLLVLTSARVQGRTQSKGSVKLDERAVLRERSRHMLGSISMETHHAPGSRLQRLPKVSYPLALAGPELITLPELCGPWGLSFFGDYVSSVSVTHVPPVTMWVHRHEMGGPGPLFQEAFR